jgi:hypothetical protein
VISFEGRPGCETVKDDSLRVDREDDAMHVGLDIEIGFELSSIPTLRNAALHKIWIDSLCAAL